MIGHGCKSILVINTIEEIKGKCMLKFVIISYFCLLIITLVSVFLIDEKTIVEKSSSNIDSEFNFKATKNVTRNDILGHMNR